MKTWIPVMFVAACGGSSPSNPDGGLVPDGSTDPVNPGFTKVATGEYETFYLVDGTVYAYGASTGTLGVGNTAPTAIPPVPIATPAGLKFIDVQGGLHQSLAVDENGHVWTWGDTTDGLRGDGGASTDGSVPYMIETDIDGQPFDDVRYVYASDTFDAVIKNDGTIWIWGNCNVGVVGDGTAGGVIKRPQMVPAFVPDGVKITQLAVSSTIVALDSNGDVWSWGGGEQDDDLGTGGSDHTHPNKVVGLPGHAVEVANGAGHYALTADGVLYGWGYRGAYLGLGAPTENYFPTPTAIDLTNVLKFPAPVKHIASGMLASHAILTDGTLWGWGDAGCGGVGDGSEPDQVARMYTWDFMAFDMMIKPAVQIVPGVHNFKAIFETQPYVFYAYAITEDGHLYSWGRNKTGVLGNGVYPDSASHNGGVASQISATYPNSWDVPLATEVSPMTLTAGIPTLSPWCVLHPEAMYCSN